MIAMNSSLITRKQIQQLERLSHRARVRLCCKTVLDYMRTLHRETIEATCLPAPLRSIFG